MKTASRALGLTAGLWVAWAGPGWGYVNADCDVSVRVDVRVENLSLDQELGSERLECVSDGKTGVREVRLVRLARSRAAVRAEAHARGEGRASARYSDSCSASCSGGGSGTCHTSGSGWDSCSDSRSGSDSKSRTQETTFAVARASLDALVRRGFTARPSSDPVGCEVADRAGAALDPLKAIALVTWIYGEELMKESGADIPGILKRSTRPAKALAPWQPPPPAGQALDDRRRK